MRRQEAVEFVEHDERPQSLATWQTPHPSEQFFEQDTEHQCALLNPVDGAALMDAPSLDPYSRHLFDIATGKYWHELTAAERALSAATPRGVVWDGDQVRQAARRLLDLGEIALSTETAASGFLGAVSTTSAIAPFKTFAAPIRSRLPEGLCESPPALPAPVQHVLLVAESNCSPVELAEIGAAHGALAVIEVEAGSQSPPPTFGSRDVAGLAPRIPVLRVGRQDGELLGEAVGSNLTVAWNEDSPAGGDSEWRPYVYTPARHNIRDAATNVDAAIAEAGATLDTAAPGSGSAACGCRLEHRNGEGMSWLLGSAVSLACLRRRSVRSKR